MSRFVGLLLVQAQTALFNDVGWTVGALTAGACTIALDCDTCDERRLKMRELVVMATTGREEEARKKSRRCGRVLLIRLLREEAGVRAVSGTAEGRRRKSGGLLFCQECGMMCQYSNEYDY